MGYFNKGKQTDNNQSYASIQSKSTSLSSSNALISLGPYAYIVRQPGVKEITEKFGYSPLGVNRKQEEQEEEKEYLQSGIPCESNNKKQIHTEKENEKELFWISPIAPLRYEHSIKGQNTSMASDPLAFSPQPNLPPDNSYLDDNTHNDRPREWNVRREYSTKSSPQASTKLLAELLRRMQRHLTPEHKSSPLSQPHDSSTRKSKLGNHPNKREEEEKQQRNCYPSKTLSSSNSHVKTDTQHIITPTHHVEEPRHNEALESIAINPQYTEKLFQDTEGLPSSKSPPRTNRSSLDTLEWGDQLWRDIKEDDERMCRWLAERGLCPNGDVLALRVLADYLKKKVSRVEDEYNQLFWSSRQNIPPLQHEDFQEISLGILGGKKISLQKQKQIVHPYGNNAETKSEYLENRTHFSDTSRNKPPGILQTFSKNNSKKRNNTPIVSKTTATTVPDDNNDNDDDDSHKKKRSVSSSSVLPLPISRKSYGHSSKKAQKCRFVGDVSSFYTGKSLTEEIDKKKASSGSIKKDDDEISPSVSTTSSSSGKEKIMHRDHDHHHYNRHEEKYSVKQSWSQEKEVETKKMDPPKFWREGMSASKPSKIPQLPEDPLPPLGALIHPLTLPNITDVHDLSAIVRLRNYCNQLKKERDRLLHKKCTQRKEKTDGVDTVSTTTKRTTSQHCHLSQNHHDRSISVQCSLSSISSPSSDGRDVPLSTHYDDRHHHNYQESKQKDEETMTMAYTKKRRSNKSVDTTTLTATPPKHSVSCQTDGYIENNSPIVFSPFHSLKSSRSVSNIPHEPRTGVPYGALKEVGRSRSQTAAYLMSPTQPLHQSEVVSSHSSANVIHNSPLKAPPRQEYLNKMNMSYVWSVGSTTSHPFPSDRVSAQDYRGATKVLHHSNCKVDPVEEIEEFTTPDKGISLTAAPESLLNEFPKEQEGQNLHLGVKERSPVSQMKSNETSLLQGSRTPSRMQRSTTRSIRSGAVVYSSSSSEYSSDSSNTVNVRHGLDNKRRLSPEKPQQQRFTAEKKEFPFTTTTVTNTPTVKMSTHNPNSSLSNNNMYEMNRSRSDGGGSRYVGSINNSNISTKRGMSSQQQNRSNSITEKSVHGFFVRVIPVNGEFNNSKEKVSPQEKVIVSRSRRFGLTK
ncbi:uncharacterized protein TM35_000011530 [Trypanosoma theileri]|uniref:Uncharacterized protein n=1 Tax=Trypanosoma theileri TaxID=67003 RepID=A0A1X0P8K9_9TRYP|nr:uncharacterized protein TM35_000011530 [Trypanosoma theileri]ORC93276.1 hypothetical protein TM35_000011530 [Trypanosoma theileri]